VPYVIMGNIDSHRIVKIVRTLDFSRAFYQPLARGEELTPELLALTPDPFVVEGPARGDMPEIFGEALGVWTIKDNVKRIIEELESGVHAFIPVNLRVRGSDKDWGQAALLAPEARGMTVSISRHAAGAREPLRFVPPNTVAVVR
jgi:hypothetical protein